jgi:hypothetical protein
MAQQTAVEWFADEILKAAIVFLYNEKNEGKFSLAYDELIEQAKQMDKEQHKETFKQSRQAKIFEEGMPPVWENFEQYYNEIYGKQ